MELLSAFIKHVKTRNLFNRKDRLLLAVSGGIDSVVLTHLCAEAGYTFALAHCNFGLRGAESDRDEASVQELAAKVGVQLYVKKFDTEAYATTNKCSIQVAARQLRYEWFASLMSQEPGKLRAFDFLLTAHHAADNVETVLINFCKGTGVKGLGGIPEKRGAIVRPLLFASREEVEQYASAAHLIWVEDSSNREAKYTRNYFRQVVVPGIQKMIPEVAQNISENITRFREVGELYEQAILAHKQKLLEYRGDEIHIPVLKLARALPLKTITYEIIREFGFGSSQIESVLQLLESSSSKYILSATHRILRNRAWIIITPLKESNSAIIIVDQDATEAAYPGGVLELRTLQAPGEKGIGGTFEVIDAAELQYPLLLRRWKDGDYFYPLGMTKKKKLARFFIDQKLSKIEKETVWVLESSKRIVWVIGHRIDNRFKVTPGTQKALSLHVRTPGTVSQKRGRSQ